MKKLLVVLMALLFTTGAFAADTAKFDYNFWGLAYGAMGSWGSDEKWDYQHFRIRPMFTAGNENIKGVVRLQIDQKYGRIDDGFGDPVWNAAGPFARNRAVRVQYAYMQLSNLFMDGLTFATGLKGYDYPLIADTELALTSATFDFGMGNVSLYYAKINEDEVATKTGGLKADDDAQLYIIDATINAGDIAIRPALFYADTGKDIGDEKWYMGAINASGDMGMFDFDATCAYLSIKHDRGATGKKESYSGYGVDLNVNVKPDADMVIGLFGTYTSGAKGDKKLGFADEVAGLFVGDTVGKLFLLQRGGIQDYGGYLPGTVEGFHTNSLGAMTAGLSFQYKVDKLTLLGQVGYMTLAKKNTADEKNVGTEIDLKISFDVAPKTSLFLEYAYVMGGDDSICKDDIQQILWGLKTSI